MEKSNSSSSSSVGFTIVELLVVIVIIGILAAITIVSYSGITQRANAAALQSDLANNSKLLSMYYTEYGYYPTTLGAGNCPSTPTADTKYCLKSSSNTTLSYQPNSSTNATQFSLYANKGTTYYRTSSDLGLSTNPITMVCPYGFIVVPGSTTYSTSDFCVMKYEAKQVGATTTPISQARGTPWLDVNQELFGANNDAKEYSPNVDGCTGCHLITEAEWLTIAQNVLSVPNNWNGGVVGTSYIYSGHNDGTPFNALEANTNDSDGYYLTGQTTGNQRRTLTLTNGEVIWDLAGNVWDWTSGTVQSPTIQPGIAGAGAAWRDWNAATTTGTLPVNPFPSYGTPAASGWNAGTNGIGRLYSSSDEAGLRGFLRGGDWGDGGTAGVLALALYASPSTADTNFGFRVSR